MIVANADVMLEDIYKKDPYIYASSSSSSSSSSSDKNKVTNNYNKICNMIQKQLDYVYSLQPIVEEVAEEYIDMMFLNDQLMYWSIQGK